MEAMAFLGECNHKKHSHTFIWLVARFYTSILVEPCNTTYQFWIANAHYTIFINNIQHYHSTQIIFNYGYESMFFFLSSWASKIANIYWNIVLWCLHNRHFTTFLLFFILAIFVLFSSLFFAIYLDYSRIVDNFSLFFLMWQNFPLFLAVYLKSVRNVQYS